MPKTDDDLWPVRVPTASLKELPDVLKELKAKPPVRRRSLGANTLLLFERENDMIILKAYWQLD